MFYNKLTSCCNPSSITLNFIKVTSTGSFTDFTVDSKREVEQEVVLRCFYMRNISDKQREKFGITQSTTDVVYISPIELEKKLGSKVLPDYVRNSYAQVTVSFLGKHHEIDSIIDLEPMHDGKEHTCLAYQMNLKQSTGNNDMN